ncbi:MAG: mechanosensitive ion channel [Desulfobacteraceae bacterium]|nr:mechanosensitive ion channel [Desulfobacteraceae bacterium]
MEQIFARLVDLGTVFGVKLLAAIVVLVLGRWVAMVLRNFLEKSMRRTDVDETLISFTANLAYIALFAFVIIAALAQLGIQTTSFIAILGAAGLAIGLALQGSLANFAAGVLMLLFKPFKVGDYIEGGSTAGTVKEIQIFNTILLTPDNKTVIVPNAKMTGDKIVNYAAQGTRRVDMVFGISYDSDIDKAKQILHELLKNDSRILPDPAPMVVVLELADSSVNIACRPWVNASDYWTFYFDMMEGVKKQFDANGISIPFPQRDVHMYQEQAA